MQTLTPMNLTQMIWVRFVGLEAYALQCAY